MSTWLLAAVLFVSGPQPVSAPPAGPAAAPAAGAPATALAADAAPTLEAAGWCVIVASPALDGYASARKAVERARKAGFPRTGIYDTRDFGDLTWGQLAVIAAQVPDKAAAMETSKALRKAGVDAYSKPCTPAPTARPLLAPPLPLVFTEGCFAWSRKLGAAACVTGATSIQEGAEWALEFPGAELPAVSIAKVEPQVLDPVPLAPSGEALAGITTALREGGFAKLAGAPTALGSGATVPVGRLRVTWKRVKEGTVTEETGSWPTYEDTFAVRCPDGRDVELTSRSSENTDPASARVWAFDDGRYLLLEFWATWGIEGDFGNFREAVVFDTIEGCKE